MSFTLELNAESILHPTRADQFTIEAAMLWPEDESARRTAVRASMTEYCIRHLPELTPDVLHHVREHLVSGAPLIRDLQPQIDDRIWHGTAVGMFTIRSSVGAKLLGPKPLGEQQAELAKRLKPDFQIEPKTMQNAEGPLSKFRPVAHLWATHGMFASRGRTAFPCTVADIPEFLGTAEAIRTSAESTLFPRSKWTVMRPGEAVQLPNEVLKLLPKVNFILATIPETAR